MTSAARYLANFVAQSNNILDASIALADLGPDVLANIIVAGSELANITTSNIVEGSNLYFTNGRVVAALTAGENITIDANGLITGEPGYIDENAYANSQIWFANVTTSNIAEGTNLYYTDERAFANTSLIGYASNLYLDSRLETKANVADLTTANVTEDTNLYFTNTRAIQALTAGDNITIEANGLVIGQPGYVDENAYANSQIWFANVTTSDIAEGNNLYFTNARVFANVSEIGYASNTYVDDRFATKANVADLTTSNVAEGSNLYYTDERVRAAISVTGTGSYDEANGIINIVGGVESVNGETGNVVLSTSNIAEGSNLYFTNERVFANVVAGGFATESYVDSGIANLVNSAPEALDTLYELANALGNDANFATSISTLIGKSYDQANAAYDEANTKTVAADLTTANVVEVTNLYFTNDRVYANVTEIGYAANSYVNDMLATKANTTDLTTANVIEDGNLYYTNDRVYANVLELGYASNLYVDDRLSTKANVADLTTSNVVEGSNLYFSNDRAIGALTSSDDIIINGNGLVSSNVGAFKSILVNGMANVVAEPNDSVEFVAGTGMTILTNPNVSPKIISFSANVSGVSGAAGGNLDFGSILQPAGFTLDLGSII